MAARKSKKAKIQQAGTIAGIDIGTNAIRMAVAQVLPNGDIEVLERLQRALRLGQDTFRKGRLGAQSMRAAIIILRDFQKVLRTYNVQRINVVATSAVREASNVDTFIDRVYVSTGLEVNVINAAEESRLNVSALRHDIGKKFLSRRKALICEVGGGGTVLSVLEKGEIIATQSLAIGSVRIREALSTGSDTVEDAATLIERKVSSAVAAISGVLALKRIQTFIALGGDARWAGSQLGRKTEVPALSSITQKSLGNLISQYEKYSIDELTRSLKLPFSDAETLTPALMVYNSLLSATNAREMLISDVTMRDGILLDLAGIITDKHDVSVARQILNSVNEIAKKYRVDIKHANHVRFLASRLFDQLKEQQWLTIENRVLLEAAAMLHEVGIFLNSRARHKHTLYIIAHSEIFGLSPKELEMVAHIARYHRRSRPKPSHLEYMAMNRQARMIVNKLAGLLRVADALDVNRKQQVKDFTCRIEEDELLITTKGNSDLTLEKKSVAIKGDLFEDIFGLKIRLE